MPPHNTSTPGASESRLDSLREEAARTGRVSGRGTKVAGGPIPHLPRTESSYYGQPIIKPPVWTWQVGMYFFIGGTAGMSGVLALAGLLTGQTPAFIQTALVVAVVGAMLSPCLLIWDLGRPTRFLNMLRVFKWRSAMSMGVWTLVTFSSLATAALLIVAGSDALVDARIPTALVRGATFVLVAGTAIFGALLATYTGVLLGATAVPVWSRHHKLLPFHFGIVALASAAGVMELLGFTLPALHAIGLTVSSIETVMGAWIELDKRDPTTHSLHAGTSGLLLRSSIVLTGPVPVLLRLLQFAQPAAACFLLGAIFSRYGWILAGRGSALDPAETVALQQRSIGPD